MLFLKWLVTRKLHFFCRVSPNSLFLCEITYAFKRPSLQLFKFKISQFVPFWIKNPQNLSKICKNWPNREILKQKPETRTFKGTCYWIKKSCADGGNPINFFLMTCPFKVIFAYNNISLYPPTLHTILMKIIEQLDTCKKITSYPFFR